MNKPIVGISIGDLNGIGGEIILKTLEDPQVLECCTPVIFASESVLSFLITHFKSSIEFKTINSFDVIEAGKIHVFNTFKEKVNIHFGEEDITIGALAIKSFIFATSSLKNNTIDVLVTAPINKQTIQSEVFTFPGHTDYLAQELDGDAVMLMINKKLKVGLLTDHVPLKDVSKKIIPQLIEKKVSAVYRTLIQDFNIERPKIAVLSINPHVGDNGVIGDEDNTVLKPTLKTLGKFVFGPFAADSFFGSGNYKNFDAIIASYHDQGLIPFKTLSFGQGVNYTAGLDKIRTSPDHGTAFEIAGKGLANENSFKQAIYSAINVFNNRKTYYSKNQN